MSCVFENVFQKEHEFVQKEFSQLEGKTYLDHAGATLYSQSQIENASKDLIKNLYLNPHTSKHTSDCVDQIRFQVLRHFNTDYNEYSVIFTSGSTAALKLVGEAFQYHSTNVENGKTQNESGLKESGAFIYLQDNHTSVLGMRELATLKSASIICIPHDEIFKSISVFEATNIENRVNYKNTAEPFKRALVVYPAQCNFSGYKYPLKWVEQIHDGALNNFTEMQTKKTFSDWYVMLDAAAFTSTNKLDLSIYKPDFLCLSFYKIFGFPTGLGALLVRNSNAHLLNGKRYYGGGTVEIAMSAVDFHVKRSHLHERLEDGTIPFLSILAVKHGFEAVKKMIPSQLNDNIMENISKHVFNLAKYFYNQLKSIKHFNGTSMAVIYSDTEYDDITKQGGIVNFNLLRSNGEYIGYSEVTHMAQLFNIHLRSGCFCNPGACQRFLKLSNDELLKHHKAGHVCGDNNDLINGVPTGSLRVSFGYMSTEEDVDSIIKMILKCFVDERPTMNIITEKYNNLSAEAYSMKSIENKSEGQGILREIRIYPIKSCGAFRINDKWDIGPKGLKYDREWMIITETGVALSQKQDTRMCVINPSINLERKELILSFPGVKSITTPLDISNENIIQSSLCDTKVCGDKIKGFDCGENIANWLVDVLGIPGLRLIKQIDEEVRVYKKGSEITQKPISLTNQAQYLAINMASVIWLASKIESQEFNERIENLTGRFRGNLIIETQKQFEEFSWKKIQIGNVNFQMDGRCTRCQMVCIDQETGEKTLEPLRTISKHFEGKIHFGVYLSHEDIDEGKTLVCGQNFFTKV